MCFHEVQFYEHEGFLVTRVADFVRAALDAGEAAIVIATPEHRAALSERFQCDGIDAAERYIALDARKTLQQFMVNDWPDEALFFGLLGKLLSQATHGGKLQLHAFGEMVALLCADGKPQAALQLEALWNQLAKQHVFSLLCAYPIHAFGAEEQTQVFEAICSAHSHVSPSEEYQSLHAKPDHFHRVIASLQRKARSLENEIKRRVEAELAISRLAAHQEHIREDERTRIAREIHDDLGSLLTGIKAYVCVAQERILQQGIPPDPQLTDAVNLADTALVNLRRIIADLRPSVLDQLGVWAAIEWYAGQIKKQTGMGVTLDIDEEGISELNARSSNAVFRIVQEALTNVVRHAEASIVKIKVQQAGETVTVAVTDNGNGNTHKGPYESWGIAGMHERARHCGAELKVIPQLKQGTTVTLRLPLGTGNGEL